MTYNEAVAIVTPLYYTHLGRAPDASGLDFWAKALVNNQTTPSNIAAEFAKTPEAKYYTLSLEAAVQDAYYAELGRVATSSDLAYWVDQLRRRTLSEEQMRNAIHNSSEAGTFRANLPQVPQPDPRLAAMQTFNSTGNAVISYRRGDNLKSLATQAYGDPNLWWVIAQGNNIVTDRELLNIQTLSIPDLRRSSASANAIPVDDNGQAIIYANKITGYQWPEYYIPVSSQLDPIVYEENPNWLAGLAFVNGNDAWNNPSYQYARPSPSVLMPPEYWYSKKNSVDIPISELEVPINLDTSILTQLPVFSSSDTVGNPPPPVVVSTPGSNPVLASDALKKYPAQILTTMSIAQIKIVAVKNNITEYFPDLASQKIPGWGERTWKESPGIFSPQYKVVSVATDPNAEKSGSLSLFDHEFAHGYDWAMGTISLSPGFEAAFKADFDALKNASPNYEYFTKRDASSTAQSPTYRRAQEEAYAESFANYYAGKTRWFSDKPSLLKYFRALPRPVQPLKH